MPKLTVDGLEIEVPPGSTVLQACEAAGREIPVFCFHQRLNIAGNCRMCLVEMERSPKPIASCAMPASEGMVIRTDTAAGPQGAQERARDAPDQPPAGLPDLRSGRRVRPAGPDPVLRPRSLALQGEQAQRHRQGSGALDLDPHEPLHPLHALHPLPRRGRGRRGARHGAPRRARGDQHLDRARAAFRAAGQHHRSVPGRRAQFQALRVPRAPLGAAQDRIDRRARCGRLQHPDRRAPARGHAHRAAPA